MRKANCNTIPHSISEGVQYPIRGVARVTILYDIAQYWYFVRNFVHVILLALKIFEVAPTWYGKFVDSWSGGHGKETRVHSWLNLLIKRARFLIGHFKNMTDSRWYSDNGRFSNFNHTFSYQHTVMVHVLPSLCVVGQLKYCKSFQWNLLPSSLLSKNLKI
jgi:hypothetical protein